VPFVPRSFGHDWRRMRERTGDELLALPVRLRGIQLGRPVDLLLDREVPRVVGIDVLCGDELHRFLPLTTASVGDDEVVIRSALVLLEEDGLAFYRSRTFALTALRGHPVEHRGVRAGALRDIVVGADGGLLALLVGTDEGTRRVPFDDGVRYAPANRSAA
jgi:hypothetical protein